MRDYDRSLHSRLASLLPLTLALAIIPACDEAPEFEDGFELEDAPEFRSEECPANWTRYGESVGGFCCSGQSDGYGCSGTVCALDPAQTQGNPMCSTFECPTGWNLYGEWAGGFCCDTATDGYGCAGNVCALDPNQTQGNPECTDDMALTPCPPGKVSMSGMCCDGDGHQCEVPQCSETDGYYLCLSDSFSMPMEAGSTQCWFYPTPSAGQPGFPGLRLNLDGYWQTHTNSVFATSCGVELAHVFVYDGYDQTSDTNVFENNEVGDLYSWIQDDVHSLWLSPSNQYVCLVHEADWLYQTCMPPSNTVFNLAPDFGDHVNQIVAYPNWYGIGSSLWEHPNATGQSIYVSANEDLGWRSLFSGGSWTSWDHAVSSFRVTSLW